MRINTIHPNMTWYWTFLFSLLLSCVLADQCEVTIDGVKYAGSCSSRSSKFLSIPYALAPVDNLRFRVAQKFDGTKASYSSIDATKLPPMCPQFAMSGKMQLIGQEDCLYLNVYSSSFNKSDSGKSVMVWLHGGSFIAGTSGSPEYDGSKLVENEDVIVITLNYRLGYLGYYDSAETGTNFGVSDVIMALNWVKDNVDKFGGDPNKITVFGQSSGGTMIRHLLNSDRATNLFSRAIIESDPQFFGPNTKNISQDIIGQYLLTCSDCSSADCLRKVPVENILSAELDVLAKISADNSSTFPNPQFSISPNIDGDYIKEDLASVLDRGHNVVNQVDLIIGTTKDEVAAFLGDNNDTSTDDAPTPVSNNNTSSSFKFCGRPSVTPESPPSGFEINRLIKLGTKAIFSCPNRVNALRYAQLNKGEKRVYVYELTKGIEYYTNYGNDLCRAGRVCHSDDLFLVFGTYPQGTSNDLKQLSRSVQSRWASFAKNGIPNGNGIGTEWTEVDSEMEYLNIGANEMKTIDLGVSCPPQLSSLTDQLTL